jgi:hypothetical protein
MTKLCPRGKAAAKRKFKVYPSAYANAYASKICAGKIKDPSGVKRKDFKGKKPSSSKVASAAKRVRRANIGGEMKVKKAGLGAAMMFKDDIRGKGALLPLFGLAGIAKYMQQNKKQNTVVAPKKQEVAKVGGEKERTGLDTKETTGMSRGGMPMPTGTGSYIKQNIDGFSEGEFVNASTQEYYKDLLD